MHYLPFVLLNFYPLNSYYLKSLCSFFAFLIAILRARTLDDFKIFFFKKEYFSTLYKTKNNKARILCLKFTKIHTKM
ncbi:hypothetical protein DMC01_02005 [Campylobacter troglodytis]|nr:hypothetical protein DMC01_02005 [Campylobacter troglodytis]